MFRNCRSIFKDNLQAQEELLPKVLDIIPTSSENLQIEAGIALNMLLRDILIVSDDLKTKIHSVASKMIMTWSSEVLFEWRQVFTLSMRGQGLQLLKNAFEKSMQMCDKT